MYTHIFDYIYVSIHEHIYTCMILYVYMYVYIYIVIVVDISSLKESYVKCIRSYGKIGYGMDLNQDTGIPGSGSLRGVIIPFSMITLKKHL